MYTLGWMAVGAVGTVVMGGTPIGMALVAGAAGALAWRTGYGRSLGRSGPSDGASP